MSFGIFNLFLSASWCGQRATFIHHCPLKHKDGTLGKHSISMQKWKSKNIYTAFVDDTDLFPWSLSLMRSNVAICWQRTRTLSATSGALWRKLMCSLDELQIISSPPCLIHLSWPYLYHTEAIISVWDPWVTYEGLNQKTICIESFPFKYPLALS